MEKVVRIKSNQHVNQAIIFGNFTMNFNKKGIAEVSIEEETQEQALDKVIKDYNYVICYLDDVTNQELEKESQKNIEVLQKRINSLQEENQALKAANEELATQNVRLSSENKAYKDALAASKSSKTVEKISVDVSGDKSNLDTIKENQEIRKGLEKKTVEELKKTLQELSVTNPTIEEKEYKNLNKSQLIDYIMTKISAEGK